MNFAWVPPRWKLHENRKVPVQNSKITCDK